MSAPNPITGVTSVKVGSTTTFTDTTPAGDWSSTNTAVATIDSVTGVATAIAQGVTQIVYTVGSSSTSISLNVQAVSSLTNGINFEVVYQALKNRVLWQSQGLVSDSNRYFEDFHPLNDVAILQDTVPLNNGMTIGQYLENQQRANIMEMLNAIYNAPEIIDPPKLVFFRENQPLPIQLVATLPNGFVGMQIYVGKGDKGVKLNSMQLFFTETVTFNMYLYNDFFLNPVMTIPVTVEKYNLTIIDLAETVILNNLVPTAYKGGRWYLGYYGKDIIDANPDCQAIYYPVNYNVFHPVDVIAFSSPVVTDPNGNRNFQRNNIGANNLMYGMNLEISTFVDGTNKIVQNKSLLDELQGLMMSVKSVKALIFSYTTNGTQRSTQNNAQVTKLYGELDGYKAAEDTPYVLGVKDQVNREGRRGKQSFQATKSISIGVGPGTGIHGVYGYDRA